MIGAILERGVLRVLRPPFSRLQSWLPGELVFSLGREREQFLVMIPRPLYRPLESSLYLGSLVYPVIISSLS